MAVIYTGDRVTKWGTWQGPGPDGPANNGTAADRDARRFDDFAALPPDARWDRSIRMKRFQGDYSQWIPADNGSLSRAQLQGPSSVSGTAVYPVGAMRWTELWLRFNSVALRVADDFHMFVESHTPSADPGGVWTINTSQNPPVAKFRRWVGPGAFTHTYNAAASCDLGVWHHYMIGCLHSLSGTGQLSYWRDGVELYASANTANTTQNGNHYPEIGAYTYWSTSGTDDVNIAGFQVTDTFPGYPGVGGGPIDLPGLQVVGVDAIIGPGAFGVAFQNDPNRVTPGG